MVLQQLPRQQQMQRNPDSNPSSWRDFVNFALNHATPSPGGLTKTDMIDYLQRHLLHSSYLLSVYTEAIQFVTTFQLRNPLRAQLEIELGNPDNTTFHSSNALLWADNRFQRDLGRKSDWESARDSKSETIQVVKISGGRNSVAAGGSSDLRSILRSLEVSSPAGAAVAALCNQCVVQAQVGAAASAASTQTLNVALNTSLNTFVRSGRLSSVTQEFFNAFRASVGAIKEATLGTITPFQSNLLVFQNMGRIVRGTVGGVGALYGIAEIAGLLPSDSNYYVMGSAASVAAMGEILGGVHEVHTTQIPTAIRLIRSSQSVSAIRRRAAGADVVQVIPIGTLTATGGDRVVYIGLDPVSVIKYEVQYSLVQSFSDSTTVPVDVPPTGIPRITITGLINGFQYYFRYRGVLLVGPIPGPRTRTEWSETVSVTPRSIATVPTDPDDETTPDRDPVVRDNRTRPSRVRSFTVSNVVTTSASLAWRTPDNDGGSALEAYIVRWSTSSVFPSASTTVRVIQSQGEVFGVPIIPTVLQMTGLNPGTLYYVRVQARNAVGTSTHVERRFTTVAGLPDFTAPPEDPDTETPTDPDIAPPPPPDRPPDDEPVGPDDTPSDDDDTTPTPTATPPTGAPVATLTGLNTGVDATWSTVDASENGGSPIQSWAVQMSLSSTFENSDIYDSFVPIQGNRLVTRTGLENGITVYLRVAAVNDTGQGPWSNVASATPADTSPDPDFVPEPPAPRGLPIGRIVIPERPTPRPYNADDGVRVKIQRAVPPADMVYLGPSIGLAVVHGKDDGALVLSTTRTLVEVREQATLPGIPGGVTLRSLASGGDIKLSADPTGNGIYCALATGSTLQSGVPKLYWTYYNLSTRVFESFDENGMRSENTWQLLHTGPTGLPVELASPVRIAVVPHMTESLLVAAVKLNDGRTVVYSGKVDTPPGKPVLESPDEGVHSIQDPLSVTWQFDDFGDTQSGYSLRRRRGQSTDYEYYGGFSWGETPVVISSSTQGVLLPSGWGRDKPDGPDGDYWFSVSAYDSSGNPSVWSDEVRVIPSFAPPPTITVPRDAPNNRFTVTVPSVEWTIPSSVTQGHYRVQILSYPNFQVVWDSGEREGSEKSVSLSQEQVTLTTGLYSVSVQYWNTEGLGSSESTKVFSVDLVPPEVLSARFDPVTYPSYEVTEELDPNTDLARPGVAVRVTVMSSPMPMSGPEGQLVSTESYDVQKRLVGIPLIRNLIIPHVPVEIPDRYGRWLVEDLIDPHVESNADFEYRASATGPNTGASYTVFSTDRSGFGARPTLKSNAVVSGNTIDWSSLIDDRSISSIGHLGWRVILDNGSVEDVMDTDATSHTASRTPVAVQALLTSSATVLGSYDRLPNSRGIMSGGGDIHYADRVVPSGPRWLGFQNIGLERFFLQRPNRVLRFQWTWMAPHQETALGFYLARFRRPTGSSVWGSEEFWDGSQWAASASQLDPKSRLDLDGSEWAANTNTGDDVAFYVRNRYNGPVESEWSGPLLVRVQAVL